MHIIIEEYQYEADKVYGVLNGVIPNLKNVRGFISVDYVGYFYNPALKDCVFILPKVLLEVVDGKDLVFGKYKPEDIIQLESSLLTREEHDFVYELSVWIYRSLVVYNELNEDNDIIRMIETQEMSKGRVCKSNTFLDILLALQKFNRENQDFFFFILKNIHSGYNKINWTRTISHSAAYMQEGTPIYLDVQNKKRKINFDEELLIIFFSILNYIHEKYGFPVQINVNFPLIKGAMFSHYLKGMGVTRLRQIKYKYFSDKALYLWELCFAFFDRSKKVNVETSQKEYLLVTQYNNVFESIIDELIGTPRKDIPKGLKDQDDGKQIDHIYRYRDLALAGQPQADDKEVYYIGDSKYYKRRTQLGKESIAKQYTYARNVIQWNLDLFNDGKEEDQQGHIKLRDDVTEGYNIIPNFFISAEQNDLKQNSEIKLAQGKTPYFSQRQFENRLYDRDTFMLAHYDVNFLFVVALYGRNNASEKQAWKEKVRHLFRQEIQKMLNEKFTFYAMTAHEDVVADDYLRQNFQMVLGKVFTPFKDTAYYSVALDNNPNFTEENKLLIATLKQNFFVEKCKLGSDPSEVVTKVERAVPADIPESFLPKFWLENYPYKEIVVGCYYSKEHLEWITGHNKMGSLIYNVRVGSEVKGGVPVTEAENHKPIFAVLYNYHNESEYRVYHIHHHSHMDKTKLLDSGYDKVNPEPTAKKYLCYVFDEKITLGQLKIKELLDWYRVNRHIDGAVIYIKGEELIKYRE